MSDITKALIEEKLDRLRKQEATASRKLIGLQESIHALEKTLGLFAPAKRKAAPVDLHVTPDEIRGWNVEGACSIIAERNNGELRSTAARKLLVEADVLPKDSAAAKLYFHLNNSPYFERKSRGVYRYHTDVHPEEVEEEGDLPPELKEKLAVTRGENRHGEVLSVRHSKSFTAVVVQPEDGGEAIQVTKKGRVPVSVGDRIAFSSVAVEPAAN